MAGLSASPLKTSTSLSSTLSSVRRESWRGSLSSPFAGGSDTAHKPNDPNLFLNPTFAFPFNTSSTLVEAHSSLDFHYHLADLMASRRFFPNPHLRLAILGGVTAAWIEQNWKVHYETQDNNSIHMKNDWRFSGAGLKSHYTCPSVRMPC